ncbi:protein translocase subunit SecF [Candidatus Parcubacteria bacterium]|nr:MAG: protein translocase subunit SecF [Candidatus Parcubacteria bacterium]
MIKIIGNRKIWFGLSGILIILSIVFLFTWGLKYGIDFTGGSLMEIEFSESPASSAVINVLSEENLSGLTVQPLGEKGMVLRFKEVDEVKHQEILAKLKAGFGDGIIENKFDSIGPAIGNELKRKTITAVIIVIIAIIIYIAWSFRKVSKPVASWKYGLIAVIALVHDVLITLGAFSVLGHIYSIEITAPFIAAILTILGYSVNDTIVVFDRTRENLSRHTDEDFEFTVERSVNEVITRSINTSFTTLLALFAILLFGGSTIRDFSLALIIGISIGTYSSIFLASPLLVIINKIK